MLKTAVLCFTLHLLEKWGTTAPPPPPPAPPPMFYAVVIAVDFVLILMRLQLCTRPIKFEARKQCVKMTKSY